MTRWRPEASFTQTLQRAVAADGRSLSALAKALARRGTPVCVTTLSKWHTGKIMPGRRSTLEALLALELELRLDRGTLTAAVGTNASVASRDVTPRSGLIADVCRAWGLPVDDGLARELVQARLAMSADGERSYVYRLTLRAERNGADRIVSGVFVPGGLSIAIPALKAAVACRIGRTHTDEQTRMQFSEVLLPRPLALNEAITIEWLAVAEPEADDDSFEIRVHRPTGVLVAEVLFPDAEPRLVASHTGRRLRSGRYLDKSEPPREVRGVARTILANLGDGYAKLTW